MSGVEIAGITLAVLPFVVNQLDNYARGLETIKRLRQYRWELEGYSTNLSAQYAIFLNTLEIFLQDLVDDHDERSKLIQDPKGSGWKDSALQKALSQKLGRDYNVFIATVTALCGLLDELSQKLGQQPTDYSQAVSIKFIGTVKFRKIFIKAVYQDILNKIDKANQILKTLTDQSDQLKKTKSGPRRRKGGSKFYRDRRHHARALYSIFIQGECWKCPCIENHRVCFRLDTAPSGNPETAGKNNGFLMMLSATQRAQQSRVRNQWHEVELQPQLIPETVSINSNKTLSSTSNEQRKVRFATTSSTTTCVEEVHQATYETPSISDLCSTIGSLDVQTSHVSQTAIGYMLSQSHVSNERYSMRVLRSIEQDITLHSLQELLRESAPFSTPAMSISEELSRQDRLYLAVVLACAVLQFHGTWLKQQWSTEDVLFIQNTQQGYTRFEHPYVVWKVLESSSKIRTSGEPATPGGNMMHNEILLPLAVALVELSLGKTISMLYQPEDKGLVETESQLNTATRLLRRVYRESGTGYGDVVKECLYWSCNKGECFEDLRFDESVFDTVVSPLLRDFDYFQGISHAM